MQMKKLDTSCAALSPSRRQCVQDIVAQMLRIPIGIVGLALLMAACGGDQREEEPAAVPDDAAADISEAEDADDVVGPEELRETLLIATTASVVSFDPADAADVLSRDVIGNFNGSLYRDVPGEDPEPDLADGPPELSDDGLAYTVRLRDNIRFGDGLELDAHLYVELFQRQLTLGGPGSNVRVDPYVESIEALDDHTIAFTMKDEFGFFPRILSNHVYSVGHPDIFPPDEIVQLPEPPIYGTGAYILTSYTPDGERLVFEPNPYYHDGDVPYEQVIIRRYSDAATMALALINAEVDIAHKRFDDDQLIDLEAEPEITVGFEQTGFVVGLIPDHSMAPTDDIRVRQALAAVIDREAISDRAFGGLKPALYDPVPPDELGYIHAFRDRYDPPNAELAQELLADAGYSESNPAEINLAYPPASYGEGSVDAMQLIREQAEATGMFRVDLQSVDTATLFEGMEEGGVFNVALVAKAAEPDASGYVTPWLVNSGWGTWMTDLENEPLTDAAPRFLQQLTLGATEADPDLREQHYATLSEMWADEVVTIPIYLDPHTRAKRNYVQGIPDLPQEDTLHVGINAVLYFDRVQALVE